MEVLALIVVAYTTYLTREQFKRQNEDGIFFKLFKGLQNRIQNSIIIVDDEEISAYKCLKYIAKREQLKNYVGSGGAESDKVRKALQHTGSANFYKIPFKDRQHHYSEALRRIMSDHGEFLDGYFRNLLFVVEVAAASSNKDLYARFINAQLTRYEVVILFYMIAGGGNLSTMQRTSMIWDFSIGYKRLSAKN
ncbi:MAG: hypothetical protein HC840_06665 [Leptolyngbyaceae cyanobacterium RM2_2_4]|nr:hypothetical protein [Leptolyngbyaceae cyanobacterium SM1_4_3]NJO49175.1 hypothetical protein [Leptolyngbyaceae cyanobacterium RM2_2_4]